MSEPKAKPELDPDDDLDLFDTVDEEAERRADERAEADVAAGRVVPNERVIEWLRSWGTPKRLPTPYSWRK
ncbi:MAG: antitoxin [Caulobacteraceae bacterium]